MTPSTSDQTSTHSENKSTPGQGGGWDEEVQAGSFFWDSLLIEEDEVGSRVGTPGKDTQQFAPRLTTLDTPQTTHVTGREEVSGGSSLVLEEKIRALERIVEARDQELEGFRVREEGWKREKSVMVEKIRTLEEEREGMQDLDGDYTRDRELWVREREELEEKLRRVERIRDGLLEDLRTQDLYNKKEKYKSDRNSLVREVGDLKKKIIQSQVPNKTSILHITCNKQTTKIIGKPAIECLDLDTTQAICTGQDEETVCRHVTVRHCGDIEVFRNNSVFPF